MKRTILSLFAMGMLIACLTGITSAGTVVIKGSTTVLPIAQAAAEDFMKANPGVSISVSGGGSGNGMKALIDGSTDIADSSRFIKDKEVKMAVENNRFPVPHRVALDCVVPVVHPDNPLRNITIDQLKGIYSGKIRNWKEVGGKDKKIVVVSRDTSSGTYEVWESKVLGGEKVLPEAMLQASNGAVAQVVSKNPYAIGYLGIGYVNAELKALTVNGVVASPVTALTGSFPVSRELFMFTNGWPTGDTLSFLNYVVSPEGQKLVQREGFVPIYAIE